MIAIRFDGPPGAESGRFIEVERDGASISFGEWKQDGDDWLLELTEVAQLESSLAEAEKERQPVYCEKCRMITLVDTVHYCDDCHETELAEARRENEKLRDTIEEALEYRGPEWASILRYALKGDDDG